VKGKRIKDKGQRIEVEGGEDGKLRSWEKAGLSNED
jgi:hypothetical protein